MDMRIGFFMKFNKGISSKWGKNTVGEEPYFEAMARYLRGMKGVDSAELYTPSYLPMERMDIMVHVNDTAPTQSANKNVLYLQNGYPTEGTGRVLERLSKLGFDGFILLSKKMLDLHHSNGFEGTCIPLGADTDYFYPRELKQSLAFDVSYVGNDIKGRERTERFLIPATKYKLGLYGNWTLQPQGKIETLVPYLRQKRYLPYQVKLSKLSRGKLPQDDLPVLYSSSKINLNITMQEAVDWDFTNLRPLEIMACGGLLMTDRVSSVEKEFAGGAVFTDGDEDLVQKIDEYLADEKKRKAVADRGREIVHRYCSIKMRSVDVLDYLRSV
jgi:spore maturation protein CgeB